MNFAEFQAVCDEGWRRVSSTPGYLAERAWRHKFWWSLLPHGPVDPARWAAQVSMEVNHLKVPVAKAGDEVAIQVADRTRQHDQVFKVTP